MAQSRGRRDRRPGSRAPGTLRKAAGQQRADLLKKTGQGQGQSRGKPQIQPQE